MRRFALLSVLIALVAILPGAARADAQCGGVAPIDLGCFTSVVPQCDTSHCPVTVTLIPGRVFTGVVTVTVDGQPAGFHAEETCIVVAGFPFPDCSVTADVSPFDLGVCTADVAGVGRWTINCSTLPV
jgi:hypothetical protein